MAKLHRFPIVVLSAFLLVQQLTLSADPPQSSPSPAPELGSDLHSPPPTIPSPSPHLSSPPAPSPQFGSPPAPSPLNLHPGPSPTPLRTGSPPKKSLAPTPIVPSDAGSKSSDTNGDDRLSNESPGGLKGGQKAGIAIGVIAGACIVALGAILYRKRQQNVHRSQYGYAARREIL